MWMHGTRAAWAIGSSVALMLLTALTCASLVSITWPAPPTRTCGKFANATDLIVIGTILSRTNRVLEPSAYYNVTISVRRALKGDTVDSIVVCVMLRPDKHSKRSESLSPSIMSWVVSRTEAPLSFSSWMILLMFSEETESYPSRRGQSSHLRLIRRLSS